MEAHPKGQRQGKSTARVSEPHTGLDRRTFLGRGAVFAAAAAIPIGMPAAAGAIEVVDGPVLLQERRAAYAAVVEALHASKQSPVDAPDVSALVDDFAAQ